MRSGPTTLHSDAPRGATTSEPPRADRVLPAALQRIDEALLLGGLLLAAGASARWLWRRRQGAQDSLPLRPNRFSHDTIIFVVIGYLAGFLLVGALVGLAQDERPPIWATLAAGVSAQLVATAFALACARRDYAGGASRFLLLRRSAWGSSLLASLGVAVIAVGCLPLVLEYTVRVVQLVDPTFQPEPHSTLKALQDEPQPRWLVASLWLSAAGVAPLAEEIFFRGLIQTVAWNATQRRWLAVTIASLAFALAHFPNPETIPALFLFGILLGWLYERTGSLVFAIFVHSLFNLKTLLWDALAQ